MVLAFSPPYAPSGGYDLILGTNNRTTIKFGAPDRDLADFLEELGYQVFLPQDKPLTQTPDRFNGGFTNYYYSDKFGINAIQIEIARRFRVREGEKEGQELALSLSRFFSDRFLDF